MNKGLWVLGLVIFTSVLILEPIHASSVVGKDTYVSLQKINRPLGIKLDIDDKTLQTISADAGFKDRLVKSIYLKLVRSGIQVKVKGGETLNQGIPLISFYLWARAGGPNTGRFVAYEYSVAVALPIKLLTRNDLDSGVVIVWERDHFGTLPINPTMIQAMVNNSMSCVDEMDRDFNAARASQKQI
jgi:hypothetical protein